MRCSSCKLPIDAHALYCGNCGARTRVRHDSQNGTVIDDVYRIDERIARGGCGSVYRATHLASGTPIALKILHADLAADPTVRARFARETRCLAKLRSRHTVVTFHRGESPDGTLYIAMELLRGETARDRLRRCGCLPWLDVLAILRAVCRSLAEAHACGIVHRDLSPANIHIGEDEVVKVLDFGVAKLMPWSGIDSFELTMVGEVIGTLDYMAPELLLGGECDARTDIYSLGVVAYELISGVLPFAGASTAASIVTAVLTEAPPPLTMVPADVDAFVARCLDRDASRRFPSVVAVASAIDRIVVARASPVSNQQAQH
jgi:eukaryotic-like serine/threonine-protein kinase